MRRKLILRLFLPLFLICLVVWYSDCAPHMGSSINNGSIAVEGSSSSSNPNSNPSTPNTPSAPGETITGNPLNGVTHGGTDIANAICIKISNCFPSVADKVCLAGVDATNGISEKLGFPAGLYDPFSALLDAEAAGTVVSNADGVSLCTSAIASESCSDPNVVKAYNPALSNPFAGVPNMVPMNPCAAAFTE